MDSTTSSTWKPDRQIVRWARSTVIALVAGGMCGPLMFLNTNLATGALVLALPVAFFSLFMFWLAIGRSQVVPAPIKRQLRRNVLLMGPIPALQVLIFNRFPESSFSGLSEGAQ